MSSPESINQPLNHTQPAAADDQGSSDASESRVGEQSQPSVQASESPVQRPVPPAPPARTPFVPREERDRRRREALAGLVVGEWREGKVTGIAQFGAFVDLGGVDGLVHVSQLGTGGYVERVEDVVQVGQVVRVRVAEVDLDRGRVSLSMREARPSAPSAPRGDRPAPSSTAPRPPRPATPSNFAPTWGTEPAPEQPRHDRRSRGSGDRGAQGGNRDERSARRTERPRRPRDADDQEWRSVRGDPRNYYSFGEEQEDEPAPTTPEELVARFGRRGNNNK